jgi:hypothetical protein
MHDPLTDRDLPWVGLAGGAEEDEARVGGRRRQVRADLNTAPGQAAAPSTEPQSASRLEPTPSCG